VRLLEKGLDTCAFADALTGVLAQRLVRKLCLKCRAPTCLSPPSYAVIREAYIDAQLFETMGYASDASHYRPSSGGCEPCNHTGFKGRMGIHELLVVSEEIRELIFQRAKVNDIRKTAMAQGMKTMKQDGIDKIFHGDTTFEELLSAC
jgi:type II secretory ATPase GspE/PulE/Tfp pilus assembly ATPase PilB-like protein